MRLTLRTLLAYRDRVLRAHELESMHARVQQSAMAGNLLKRIEALVQRPTILAPPIDGKGLGADANSVAEYLDDALPGDKVPELERICLESDVQLAELAQCHHLLSSAMSTSVEVPPALQARIAGLADPEVRAAALLSRPTGLSLDNLNLPESAEPPPFVSPVSVQRGLSASEDAAVTGAGVTPPAVVSVSAPELAGKRRHVQSHPVEAPMVASGGASIRPSGLDLEGSHLAHEVPEYLRGRSRDGWRAPLAIGALLALLIILVWQSIGSWDTIRDMLAKRETESVTGTADAASEATATVMRQESASAPVSSPAERSLSNSNVEPTGQQPVSAASDLSTKDSPGLAALPREQVAVDSSGAVALNSAPQPNISGAANLTDRDNPSTSFAVEWLPIDASSSQAIVLARFNQAQPWFRVSPAQRLSSGVQVVIPPACRPKLDLVQGPSVTIWGPAMFSVEQPEAGSSLRPRLQMQLGKVLLSPSAANSEVDIAIANAVMRVSMADAATRVAIEVAYSDQAIGPMTDRQLHPVNVAVAVIEGQATVALLENLSSSTQNRSDASSKLVTLAANQGALIRNSQLSAGQAIARPTWLEVAAERAVEALAAQDLHRQWTNDSTAEELLLKWIINRRPENRCLAAQTLTLMGNWQWLTLDKNTLDEPRDRSYWNPVIELGRQVLAVDPSQVAQLRSALVARDRERGPIRAEVWLGLSRQQLDKGGAQQLVSMLESDQLIDRILGIHELRHITGKDLGYQPGEPNRPAVQQWQRELSAGAIVPAQIPAK